MAPTVAVIKLPIVPSPVLNPITPNNQPPSSAPTKQRADQAHDQIADEAKTPAGHDLAR